MLELGCGLALPSVVAARAGARVLATDGATDAVAFAAHVLSLNEVEGEVAHVDWSTHGDQLVARGPFDLVLAADVLYTKANVDTALELFPRLVASGGELRIADPNRAGAQRFFAEFESPPCRARMSRSTPSGLPGGRLGIHRSGGGLRRESVANHDS